jgi:small subunit ribosomal protein S18
MTSRKRTKRRRPMTDRGRKKKVCQFCRDKNFQYIDYKDVGLLRKYVSDRGKIRARRTTGVCARHQRELATAIKNAREMALLPYVQVRQ